MGIRSKHGKLFLDFSWRGVRCREYVRDADTPANRKSLAVRWRLIAAQIEAGTFDYRAWFPQGTQLALFYPALSRTTETVGDYLDRWQARRSPFDSSGGLLPGAELHPTTWLKDRYILRRLVAAIGSIRLADLSREHLLNLRHGLVEAGLAAKTIRNVMGLAHKALNDAVESGLVEKNPAPKLKRRLGRASTHQPTPLTPAEVSAFLNALPRSGVPTRRGSLLSAACMADFYGWWFRTGWRSNEIVALRFDDVSTVEGVIDLRHGRSPRMGGLEATPKTGPRRIAIDYDLELLALLERRRQASIETGRREFVFADSRGAPINQEWIARRIWKPTLRVAGISSRGQYSIRDTFISLAISAGEDPGWVAQVCGTSERMIFIHYRRWMPGADPSRGRRIAGLLSATRRGAAGTTI